MTDAPKPFSLSDLAGQIGNSLLFGGRDGLEPINAFHHQAGGHPRLAVLTGENASGKSLMCRFLTSVLRRDGVEFMHVGFHLRTAGNAAGLAGPETETSTGHNSQYVVLAALTAAEMHKTPVVLCFDEPDIGLDEGYAAAMGALLAQKADTLPAHVLGVLVVSHSRALLGALRPSNPHHFRLGDNVSFEDVLDRPAKARSVEELLALPAQAQERALRFGRLMRHAQSNRTDTAR